MGLSLKSIDSKGLIDHFNVGSYRWVHVVRRKLVMLYALRVFDTAQATSDSEAKAEANSLIDSALPFAGVALEDGASALTREDLVGELHKPTDGVGIDYSMFDNDYQEFLAHLPALVSQASEAMVGLYKFVHHSDCGGRHSRGDVADILQFLDFVEPVFEESDDASYFLQLQAFFRHTERIKGYVAYA